MAKLLDRLIDVGTIGVIAGIGILAVQSFKGVTSAGRETIADITDTVSDVKRTVTQTGDLVSDTAGQIATTAIRSSPIGAPFVAFDLFKDLFSGFGINGSREAPTTKPTPQEEIAQQSLIDRGKGTRDIGGITFGQITTRNELEKAFMPTITAPLPEFGGRIITPGDTGIPVRSTVSAEFEGTVQSPGGDIITIKRA